MTTENTINDKTLQGMNERRPYRVRLPGFISDQEIGLGDVIKQVSYVIGIRPCDGCNQRAVLLNRLVVLSPWHRR